MNTNSIGVQHNGVVGPKNGASVARPVVSLKYLLENAGDGNRFTALQTSEARRNLARSLSLAA